MRSSYIQTCTGKEVTETTYQIITDKINLRINRIEGIPNNNLKTKEITRRVNSEKNTKIRLSWKTTRSFQLESNRIKLQSKALANRLTQKLLIYLKRENLLRKNQTVYLMREIGMIRMNPHQITLRTHIKITETASKTIEEEVIIEEVEEGIT